MTVYLKGLWHTGGYPYDTPDALFAAQNTQGMRIFCKVGDKYGDFTVVGVGFFTGGGWAEKSYLSIHPA